jgi:hypothetical protein
MLSYLVLLLFFAILAVSLFGKIPQRFLCILLVTVFIPPCVAFFQTPTISPHQTLLYTFFFLAFWQFPHQLKDSFFAFPLKFPLFLLAASLLATAFFCGEGAKGIYNAFRYFMESYSYLLLAFICGSYYKNIDLLNKLFWPILIVGLLGIFEFGYGDNILFRIICNAFPIYDGYLDLNNVLSMSRSYRMRVFITTQHPSALGSMACCFILVLTTQIKNLEWTNIRKIVAFSSLGLILFLSGSRSALVCCLFCLLLMCVVKLPIVLKIITIGALCFVAVFSVNKFVESFSEEGQGSSISMRQEQILYSYVLFIKSPIVGNGVRYTSKNVMQRDSYNDRVLDTSIGGLESVVFYQLIDYGLLGLFSYFLLFVCGLFYFFRRRKFEFANTGFFVMLSFLIFAILSGEIGGNNVLAYLLSGFCLGAVHEQESKKDLITDNKEE